MAMKSSNPERHAPGNRRLAEGLARLTGAPSRADRSALQDALMSGPLLLAVEELPGDFDPSAGEAARLRFVCADAPERGRVLCGFSSQSALAAKAPAAVALALDPASLIDWIVASAAPGLLIDPEGAAFFVSQDDARQLLGLPPVSGGPRRAKSLGEAPERAVREALDQLLARGAAGVLDVAEARTGKALRFERAPDASLRLVLTGAALASDERARAQLFFDELAGPLDDLPDAGSRPAAPPDADFQALFSGDTARPARAALKIFTWVFGFLPGFELRVELR